MRPKHNITILRYYKFFIEISNRNPKRNMNVNKINVIKHGKMYSIFFMEIAEILNEEIKINNNKNNFLVTLVDLHISSNMDIIKAYINIYPHAEKILVKKICSKNKFYRKLLSKRLRYRVKKIPKLNIFVLNK